MKLPHASEAVIDLAKIRDYCLSPTHWEGKHKARVFRAALGLQVSDADWLEDQLRRAVLVHECERSSSTGFGRRYIVDFVLHRGELEAPVRSAWIIRTGEEFPRLVSCYVL